MEKLKLSKITDFIFKVVLIFLISFVWLRFYLNSLYVTLLCSIFITAILTYLLQQKNYKQQSIKNLKKEELKKIDEYTIQLLLSTKKEQLAFFSNLISKEKQTQIKNDCIIFTSNKQKTALIPMFNSREITIDDITLVFKKIKGLNLKKIIVVANSFNANAIDFGDKIENIEFCFLNKVDCYTHLFKKYDYYPKITIKVGHKSKVTKKLLLQTAFNRRKTKSYIFSGLILFLASFVIPYNIYYVTFSSLLFLMALFSYFNVFFNKPEPKNII